MAVRQRTPRVQDPAFLAWAHQQPGVCCLCRREPWRELHHFGSQGGTLRGDDEYVCRVCSGCHHPPNPARKRVALIRDGAWEEYARMLEDAMDLNVGYRRQQVAPKGANHASRR